MELKKNTTPPRKTEDNGGVMLMLLIFILAGAFSSIAQEMGCVNSVVNMTLSILPGSFILVGMFIASCLVSLSIGTSCGTIAALTPIAVGIASATSANVPMATAVVVGGSLFGDNLSFISDTTIMATKTQGCRMSDKFKANIGIALPASIIAIIAYLFIGSGIESQTGGDIGNPLNVLPYLVVFILAIAGMNVIWVLIMGIITAIVLALSYGTMDIPSIWEAMQKGVLGMHDLIIVTIIAAVIIDQLRKRGAIDWLIMNMGRIISSRRGAELSIAGAVVAVDLLTANNTIAILAVGPVARSISYRYGIEAKRAASILDTMSCFAQGIIPWGAQLLIAAGLASINPLDIIPYLYYPYILGTITILNIIFYKKKATDTDCHEKK
ncbi:MAG: Na+/H+ antiporter NhaC family protein [Bacteroidaceae bacterium]|jgi:Na+/H+ antiporter NhaC|nr:Na+/H+ antiporter NhaC family protein [Bacteroidaceae bacterium]